MTKPSSTAATDPIDSSSESSAAGKPNALIGLLSTTKFWFSLSLVTVAAISIYDAYLVYEFRNGVHEENPICEWLINLEPDSVVIFLLGKCMGTLGVVVALVCLHKFWRKVALPVALSLVAFQVGLMAHIHTADNLAQTIAETARHVATQHELSDVLRSEARKNAANKIAAHSQQVGHVDHRRRRRAQRRIMASIGVGVPSDMLPLDFQMASFRQPRKREMIASRKKRLPRELR